VTRVIHAEWTKLRTVPSTAWLLAGTVAATVALGAAATGTVHTRHCPTETTCLEDTTKLSLTGVRLGQVLVVALAVLAVSNEYGTRMIAATLTATPRRDLVLAAKAAVLTAVVLVAGTAGVLGSLLAGRMILPHNGFTAANGYPPPTLTDGPTLRAAAGTVLYLGLIALLSLGVGALVRDTAGGITAVLGLLFAFPLLTMVISKPKWELWLKRLAPMDAGLSIQSTTGGPALPIQPWTGLGVLAAYAAVALAAGWIMLRLRDA
jgi:ABC-2 type transport system permease protein